MNPAIRDRSPAQPGRLKVLILSNRGRDPQDREIPPDTAPDPSRLPRLLAKQGIDVVELDLLPPPRNPWRHSHPLFAGIDPLRALTVLLRHRSVDLVISVFESPALVPLLLRRPLCFRPPIILWDVGLGGEWRVRQQMLEYVLPRIDGLLALTRFQKDVAERRYPLRSPAKVIGYTVDEQFFRPDETREGDYVLSVGEDLGRDYPTLIAALDGVPARTVLKTRQPLPIGAGRDNIRVIRERLPYSSLRELYQDARLVIVPLLVRENPSGITTLFEAMATGRAIIASDTPMVREFISHRETGLLVPVGDVDGLRAAILRLLGDAGERTQLGRAARRIMEEHFSAASFAERFASAARHFAGLRNGL